LYIGLTSYVACFGSNLVNALAKLRDRRLIRAEMVSTGGRPGECWWPVQTPTTPLCVGSAIATPIGGDTSEGTQAGAADRQTEQDGSFGSNGPAPDGHLAAGEANPLALGDLFSQVQEMGGKIARSKEGGFAVQGVEARSLTGFDRGLM